MEGQRRCDACGTIFVTTSHNAKYCGKICRQAAWKARQAGVTNTAVEPIGDGTVPAVAVQVEQGGAVALDATTAWLGAALDALPAEQRAIFGPRIVAEIRANGKERRALGESGGGAARGSLDDVRARRAEQTMGLEPGTLDAVPDDVVVKLLTAYRGRAASS